jgi:hypothetical protein
MTVVAVWEAGGPAPAPGEVALCFDPLALAEQRGAALAADALVTLEEGARIDDAASALVARIAADPAAAAIAADGLALGPAAANEVLCELANVLRAWSIGRAALAHGARGPLRAPAGMPSAIRAGLWAALDGASPPPLDPWVGLIGAERPPEGIRPVLAAAAQRVAAQRTRTRDVRVVAVPAMKVAAAIEATPAPQLRAAGLAVSLFPGLDHGNAARLALRSGLAAIAPSRGWRADRAAGASPRLGRLHDDAALDGALRAVAGRVLAGLVAPARRVAPVLASWERLPGLRAVLLPTAAMGSARLVAGWARERGVRLAVVQHGIYGFSAAERGDGLADTLLSWGPGVAAQARAWPAPRPHVVAVGAPGIVTGPARPRPVAIERVLVTTTNRPLGSALGLFGFCEAFIDDLAPGLRVLREAGVKLELRPHPSEDAGRYEAQLARLGVEMAIGPAEPLAARLGASDLLVSSISSAAFEAAALGVPVLLWVARVPAAVRAEHLVEPLSEPLAGFFASEDEFLALAQLAATAPQRLLDVAFALGERLASFAGPFDADAFAAELAALAA